MNVTHSVNPIRQPNVNACWATAAAMVLRLHGLAGVNEVMQRASSVGVNANGSLPPSAVPALARILHLQLTDLVTTDQAFTPAVLSRALRNSCAAAFGEYNYPGVPTAMQHVLLFYKAAGSDADPMVYFVDPYTGGRLNYLLSEINYSLGSVDYLLYQ